LAIYNIEKKVSQTPLKYCLRSGQVLCDVAIVGSRKCEKNAVNSAVPIDIINVKELQTQSGKPEINELLQYVAPSSTPTNNWFLMELIT
jgi:iron complex outermembrane receptor protein